MVFNYPLTVFDEPGKPINSTLGFHIDNLQSPRNTVDLEADELLLYIKTVFDMLMHSQILDFLEDEEAQERTVRIDDFGIPATEFSISSEQQMMLYESGKLYTEKYLTEKLGLTAPIASSGAV
jgi:NTE family protein